MVGMALKTFYDSNYHLEALNSGFLQFPSSDYSLEEQEQSQASAVSLLNAASGNSMHSGSRIANFSMDSIPSTIGLSAKENSLLRDARFAFSESPNMNGSVTANLGSSFNFVQQPALFSSQETSLLIPKRPQVAKRKQQQNGLTAKTQNLLASSVNQDLMIVNQRYKKPRLDINEETMAGQVISEHGQQTLGTLPLKRNTHKHQLSGLVQHHMLQSRNKVEASQSVPLSHGGFTQTQNQLMSDQLQEQVVHRVTGEQQPDEGVFTHRLMQYVYHLRNGPPENSISYWRKFVSEYFAPGATKRWCVSLYDKFGIKTTGIIPKSAMEWQCHMCGCKEGSGFEVTFDSLPRLTKLMFERGVVDELLFLDFPKVCRFPSGLILLKYGKAVQESVYENFRVVHEGQLHIVFTQELKILSWEFCASCHEVLVPKSLVMSKMVRAVEDYKKAILNGILPQCSLGIINQIQEVGCRIANAMNSVDDIGFSESYTRCLQIAEISQSMKDLMTFSQANEMGPIESFKHCFPQIVTPNIPKWETQEKHQLYCPDLSADKFVPAFPPYVTTANECSNMVDECLITASEHEAYALTGFHHKPVRVNQILDHYSEQVEAGTNTCSKLLQTFQGPQIPSSRSTANFAANGMSSLSRHGQSNQQQMIQQFVQDTIDSRTVNEFDMQVTDQTSRVYNRIEALTAHKNELGRASNSWAALNVLNTDTFEPATGFNLKMKDLWKQ